MPDKGMDEIEVHFFTNKTVLRYLDQLVASGLYGQTMSEAVERLLCMSLEDLIATGTIEAIAIEGAG